MLYCEIDGRCCASESDIDEMASNGKAELSDRANIVAIYPSPVLIAGPLLMAISLIAGGVAKGVLLPEHSSPALFLMLLSYLFSRWYRRSAVVFTDDAVLLGDKKMLYEDISSIKLERPEDKSNRLASLNFYDSNGVKRLSLHPGAYGTGLARIGRELRPHLSEKVIDASLTSSSPGRHIIFLWVAVTLLCVLALIEGFTR